MGEKLTIIAIHGNGGGAFRFQRVYDYLPVDIEFIAITLPGFDGLPPDENMVRMRHIADYLYGTIIEAKRPVIALGSGIGGALLLPGRPGPPSAWQQAPWALLWERLSGRWPAG